MVSRVYPAEIKNKRGCSSGSCRTRYRARQRRRALTPPFQIHQLLEHLSATTPSLAKTTTLRTSSQQGFWKGHERLGKAVIEVEPRGNRNRHRLLDKPFG
jgi:hypothetical protein